MKSPLVYLLITLLPHFSKAASATQDVNLPAEEAHVEVTCNLKMWMWGPCHNTKELLMILGLTEGLQ